MRERARPRGDWMAVIAEGDVTYSDGVFDDWNEIVDAVSGADNIPVKKRHDYDGVITRISDFQLDPINKFVKAYFDGPVRPTDAISVAWEEEDGKIVGIDHVAIGNDFKPECPLSTCKITRNRDMTEDNVVEETITDNTTPAPAETVEDVDYKVLYEELNTKFKGYEDNMDKFNQFVELLEQEAEKDKEVDLKPKKEVQNEMKTSGKDEDYDPFDIARNTRRIRNLRGK